MSLSASVATKAAVVATSSAPTRPAATSEGRGNSGKGADCTGCLTSRSAEPVPQTAPSPDRRLTRNAHAQLQKAPSLLFTDIERSTPMVAELGDEYPAVLNEHRGSSAARWQAAAARRSAASETRPSWRSPGSGESSRGFRRHPAGRSPPTSGSLRFRFGSGSASTPVSRRSGATTTSGSTSIGRRICSAGHGGQVLLSEPTKVALGRS